MQFFSAQEQLFRKLLYSLRIVFSSVTMLVIFKMGWCTLSAIVWSCFLSSTVSSVSSSPYRRKTDYFRLYDAGGGLMVSQAVFRLQMPSISNSNSISNSPSLILTGARRDLTKSWNRTYVLFQSELTNLSVEQQNTTSGVLILNFKDGRQISLSIETDCLKQGCGSGPTPLNMCIVVCPLAVNSSFISRALMGEAVTIRFPSNESLNVAYIPVDASFYLPSGSKVPEGK